MIVHHRSKIITIGPHEIVGQKGAVHLINRYSRGTASGQGQARTTKTNIMVFLAVIDFGINTFRSPLTSKATDPCEGNLRLQNSFQLPQGLLYFRKAKSKLPMPRLPPKSQQGHLLKKHCLKQDTPFDDLSNDYSVFRPLQKNEHKYLKWLPPFL